MRKTGQIAFACPAYFRSCGSQIPPWKMSMWMGGKIKSIDWECFIMTEFEKVGLEIVKFMRGRYKLDEVAGRYYDVPCLKFRHGGKTIVSINLHKDYYDFQIILGKVEREKFEAIKHEFPIEIQEIYDKERTLHDGKWLFIRVDHLRGFEAVKRLILLKKSPNRKPFSKEDAVLGKCGHRCDLCVHFTGISEEFRSTLIPHLNAVYGNSDWSMRCTGCDTSGCHCYNNGNEMCDPLICLRQNHLKDCFACKSYPCEQATVGYRQLEHKNMSSDDVTWAILPYVPYQYE